MSQIITKILTKIGVFLYKRRAEISRRCLPGFKNTPANLSIELPWRIFNADHIHLGDDISLGPNCLLSAMTEYPPASWAQVVPQFKIQPQAFTPKIVIGNRVSATSNLTVAAMQEIIIEDDVMFASNINLTDGLHGFDSVELPFKYQKMCRIAPIKIKKGSWIGQNVVVLPGVTIGEFSIIGANSVVTNDIPDKCIAVGSPARVIKRWDENTNDWAKIESSS